MLECKKRCIIFCHHIITFSCQCFSSSFHCVYSELHWFHRRITCVHTNSLVEDVSYMCTYVYISIKLKHQNCACIYILLDQTPSLSKVINNTGYRWSYLTLLFCYIYLAYVSVCECVRAWMQEASHATVCRILYYKLFFTQLVFIM